MKMTPYAEIQVTTNFTFTYGASHPHELIKTARSLNYHAIAVTDHNSLAGVVRAHVVAREHGIKLLVGARLDLVNFPSLLCLPTTRNAYGRLTALLTTGKRRALKDQCKIYYSDLIENSTDQILVILPPRVISYEFLEYLKILSKNSPEHCYLAANYQYDGNDENKIAQLAELSSLSNVPLVASNDVYYHIPERRVTQDILTCIREKCTIEQAGFKLKANAERYLKPPNEMIRLFSAYPEAIVHTTEIANRCCFSLDELEHCYPKESSKNGLPAFERLVQLSNEGAQKQYPDGVPTKICAQLNHELQLIKQLNYAPYFLTVYEIVRFAKSQNILCQGRGSAANSSVCYFLGITAVDPSQIELLFERFISSARNEPPDIDIDFEHDRREEIIQHIYAKYGRDRVGMTATFVCYRARSAIRDIGKALGISSDIINTLSKTIWGSSKRPVNTDDVLETNLNPLDKKLQLALKLAEELIGFPRHLSQHVGGLVITQDKLSEIVPIGNAAMKNRTVIEWDKDDLDALNILKVDILGLGILTCIHQSFDLIKNHYGEKLSLSKIPQHDHQVYEMLCRADTIGVFQVESRAQMSMLPRLKPKEFYDLVIQVAIVRPGPIQGDMVHPYLRRRNGKETITYPSQELYQVLGKTLGVPLFQEQAMRIAVVGAGFTATEADSLRRAMATFRKTGLIHKFREKMLSGMQGNGYEADFAKRCFEQIEGFGEYGFPESHAASFAILVYISAWLKFHYPAVFGASLLNSQPMGFYAPAQIVKDLQNHGVEVRAPDINFSQWESTLERITNKEAAINKNSSALRLGLRQIKHLRKTDADQIISVRGIGYKSVYDLQKRTKLNIECLKILAKANTFSSLGLNRRTALWTIIAINNSHLPLFSNTTNNVGFRKEEDLIPLPEMQAGEEVVEDYRTLRLSLKHHPMFLLRDKISMTPLTEAKNLIHVSSNHLVKIAGLVLVRQRPGTAKGVLFVTLEDDTGIANIILWPSVFKQYRRIIMNARLIGVSGKVQREEKVVHVIANHLTDLTDNLARLNNPSSRSVNHKMLP